MNSHSDHHPDITALLDEQDRVGADIPHLLFHYARWRCREAT
jgi:hypothetical protein